MDGLQFVTLRERPEFGEKAAGWFAEKWGVPKEAYLESMADCVGNYRGIPQWYIFLDTRGELVAGAGIIENDFHDRKDLSPNLCALFVEEPCRGRGIARYLLDFARKDLGAMGYGALYLVTDHTEFYEKCGWDFFTTVADDEGNPERLYRAETLR